jgi:hypothetical protein
MREAVVVAAVAAWPPTLAAVLTFLAARRAERRVAQERASLVDQSLESLHGALDRVGDSVERVEAGVVDLRERVSRLEGAHAASVHG